MSKTYSTTIEITEEKEYSVTIQAGLDLSSWISAGSTTEYPLNPSSYESFEELEADEEAIRQLMSVHASVDYLAQATAGDSLMEDIVNSDVCAKWINLSDYAYDVLSVSWTGKNLLKNEATTQTVYGVTFTVNADKSITINGTNTDSAQHSFFVGIVTLDAGAYKVNGLKNNGGYTSFWINLYNLTDGSNIVDVKNANEDVTFTLSAPKQVRVNVYWAGNATVNNITVYPMIRKADIADPTYEPYFNAMDTADKYGYGEWGLVGQVPVLSSNTGSNGSAVESSEYSSTYAAWKVFRNTVDSECWIPSTSSTFGSTYIGYKFNTPIKITKMLLAILQTSQTSQNPTTYLSKFQIKASNDNFATFDLLDDNVSVSEDLGGVIYNVSANKAYTEYRLYPTANGRNSAPDVLVRSLQFLAYAPLGNVPIMTSNSSPYGEAFASNSQNAMPPYYAFDNVKDSSEQYWSTNPNISGARLGYKFTTPTNVRRFALRGLGSHIAVSIARATGVTLQYSNDGTTYVDVDTFEFTAEDAKTLKVVNAPNNIYALYWAIKFDTYNYQSASGYYCMVQSLQFYGRELKPLVPTMTADNAPKGEASQHMNTSDSSYVAYKAFDGTIGTWAGSGYAASGHNGEYIQYNAPSTRTGFKPKKIYINEGRSESDRVVSCQYTAIMSDDNFATTETVATLETSVASGVAVLADINTNLTKGIRLVCNSSTGNLNYSHSTLGMVYYYIMDMIQVYGVDYSEKEFAAGSTRKTIYDHGVMKVPMDSNVSTISGGDLQCVTGNSNWQGDIPAYPQSDYLEISGVGRTSQVSNGCGVPMALTSMLDLSDYSMVYAKNECRHSKGRLCASMIVGTNRNGYYLKNGAAGYLATASNDARTNPVPSLIFGIDISNIDQQAYIIVYTSISPRDSGSQNLYSDITELWLE